MSEPRITQRVGGIGPWYSGWVQPSDESPKHYFVADDCTADSEARLPKTEEDARLMAAAPDLLEALKECEAVLSRVDTLRHVSPEFPALDKARAAISKAEPGESKGGE